MPPRHENCLKPIVLDTFLFDDLAALEGEARQRLRECLMTSGAIRLRVPGAGEIQQCSLAHGKRFLLREECQKNCADGQRNFRLRYGERSLLLPTLRGEFRVQVADYLGGERGWIHRGASPSRADKEYFQWGLLDGARKDSIGRLKDNIWPDDDEFVASKLELLNLHSKVHLTLLSCLQADLSGSISGESWAQPFEVICRDTRYFGSKPAADPFAKHVSTESTILNPPHADLSNGTLISYAAGLQIYVGTETKRTKICSDESHWHDLDWGDADPDDVLYLVGLATEVQTCGRFRASWHRVVGRQNNSAERFSTVSFCNAGIDDVLPGGLDVRFPGRRYPNVARVALPMIGSHGYLSALDAG